MSGFEILAAASATLSAAGSITQGVMQNAQAQRQATILNADAKTARQLGAIESAHIAEDRTRAIGAFVADQGASGFTLDSSALSVIGDLASRYENEARNARYEAAARSTALKNEAINASYSGKMSLIKGGFDAVGSLLQGGANIAAPGGKIGG